VCFVTARVSYVLVCCGDCVCLFVCCVTAGGLCLFVRCVTVSVFCVSLRIV
jgi:hypothetical protein